MRISNKITGIVAGLICVALAACAPSPDAVLRDPTAPFGATTRFDAEKFSGQWIVVASTENTPQGPVSFLHNPENATFTLTSNVIPSLAGVYQSGAPGVLNALAANGETLVVMWVDNEFQTASVGTASGSFGAVLDRTGDVNVNKAIAAREVFDFYGWDTTKLRRTSP